MRRDLLSLLAVLAIVALPFVGGLHHEFVWIDHHEIEQGALLVDSWHELGSVLSNDANSPGYQRPVYSLLHTLDHALWGLEPFGYHLSSLLLHLVNVALVLTLARRSGWGIGAAAALAALWGLHPVNAAVAGLVHAKADLAYVACVLGAFLLLDMERRSATRRAWARAGAAALVLVGCLAKENAFLYAPAVTALWWGRWRGRGYGGHVLAVWVATAVALAPRLLHGVPGAYASPLGLEERLLTFATVYVTELGRCLVPLRLALADTVTAFSAIGGLARAAWLVGVVALLGAQVLTWRRAPWTRPWIALWNAALLPVSQIVPILHFRADRFLYLPSLAVVGLLVALALRARSGRAMPRVPAAAYPAAAALVLLLLGGRTHARVREFADDLTLFGAETARTPGYREGSHHLALALDREGRHDEADAPYRAAFEGVAGTISWVNEDVLILNYGHSLLQRRQFAAARDLYDRYVDGMGPGRTKDRALFNLGIAEFESGRPEEAFPLFEAFVEVYPAEPRSWFWAGKSAFAVQQYERGRVYLTHYLTLVTAGERAEEAREALDWLESRSPR